MALIEQFHIVADHFAVASGQEIIEGQLVKLNSAGEAVIADGSSGEVVIGVAGDTKSTSVSGLPTTNDSSQGAFVNRVSDTFDETKASGRMTVYHSGGKFATNRFQSGSFSVGDSLYAHSTGNFTNVASTSGQVVAILTQVPGDFDSGVPGIDINGSLTLGNFIEFKLII